MSMFSLLGSTSFLMPGWMLTLTTLLLSTPWVNKGVKTELNSVLKSLYDISLRCNSHIKLYFTPSARNPADAPSRVLSDKDCKLSASAWSKVQQAFGPHTFDLMSLDSNVQFDEKGVPLRHFTPFYTPMSSGINVFAQVISRDENAYVFPPFVMMGPLLKFLLQARIPVTIIAPQLSPTPYWWPILKGASSVSLLLGSKGGIYSPSDLSRDRVFVFCT